LAQALSARLLFRITVVVQPIIAMKLFVLGMILPVLHATEHRTNPIRKVVTMLQSMQKKVMAEGEKEKEQYDKFMCYCKTSGSDLSTSIAAAEKKIGELGTDIPEAESKKATLEEEVKQAQADRESAKKAMAEATSIREKEATAFSSSSTDLKTNIAAIKKAVAALEKGMTGSFLQTQGAQVLKRLVSNTDMMEEDRQEVMAFLDQGAGYAPAGGQVTGILKTMGDEMDASLKAETAAETKAIKEYEELMAAKKAEVAALTKAIEEKLGRIGELAVSIAEMKNDLGDNEASLMEDKQFLADLQTGCATKTKEWEVIVATRAEELTALAETIKVLNDDDALELFKKTLPTPSLVQITMPGMEMRTRALSLIELAQKAGNRNPHMDFIAMALKGKKIGFEKVIAMIDDMVATLKKEQSDDESKKEYCALEFDNSDDKKKSLEKTIKDEEATITDVSEAIATFKDEISALKASISALDKSVADATAQRKDEHATYQELMATDSAAKEVLKFAENRLNKFYNPKLYVAPAKRELSAEDTIATGMGGTMAPTAPPAGIAGTGITVFAQLQARNIDKVAPPPPPETFGPYSKKTEESSGVMAMMALLIKDLEKEMTEATTTEKDSQADYEAMMKDSAEKRATDSKSLADKSSALADAEADLESHNSAKASAGKELMATLSYIASLHAECDWLLKYFDVRKVARDSEIDALGKAKAVLSGADYSLVQAKSHSFLSRA